MRTGSICGELRSRLVTDDIVAHCADCIIATNLHHNSPHVSSTGITPQNYHPDNSFNTSYILHPSLLFKPWILTKNYMIFNCALVSRHQNFIYILVIAILNTATWVGDTCRRLLVTKLHSKNKLLLFVKKKKVKQSRYRPGVAQMVPGN